MKKLTDPLNQPSSQKKPTIIINLKRRKKQPSHGERNDKSVLEHRFDDLLTICKSISEDKKNDIENMLFCNEELGDYVMQSRDRGIKSSRSYHLDLPQIRQIQQENDEQRKSFSLTHRDQHKNNKYQQCSTALHTENLTNTKSRSNKKYSKIQKSRPLCSSFSVSECLINYGLPSSKFSPDKFHKVSLKRTDEAKKPVKIDVSKLLRSQRERGESKSRYNTQRQTKSSMGHYSQTCI